MSAQKEPTCLRELEKQVESEALKTSEKYKQQEQLDDEQVTKSSPKKENEDEVRLNIPQEEPILKGSNIFSQPRSQEAKINIFANSKSINLFNLSQQNPAQRGLNIFNKAMTAAPAVLPKDEDDQSENSEGVKEGEQDLKEPVERVMKYTYESQFEKLGEFKVVKFRAGEGALKEGVIASLEKSPKDEQILYLFLRSEGTKVLVYKAMLLPGVRVESFSNRKENVKLAVLKMGQEKSERELVKLQFEREQESRRFEDLLVTLKKN